MGRVENWKTQGENSPRNGSWSAVWSKWDTGAGPTIFNIEKT